MPEEAGGVAAWLGRHVKKGIQGVLGRAGLRIERVDSAKKAVLDLRAVACDPLQAVYLAGTRAAVVDVPPEDCRFNHHLLATACGGDFAHPFLRVLHRWLEGETPASVMRSLENFHRCRQEATATELLGVEHLRQGSLLRELSSEQAVLPWEGLTPASRAEQLRHARTREYRRAAAELSGGGVRGRLGLARRGPEEPAPSPAELELHRLTSVYRSIASRGYLRSAEADGDMAGAVLTHGGAWRIMLHAGAHRMAALTALGYRRVPVRLRSTRAAFVVIRREDVAAWPHVRSGLFSIETALSVFDRIFEGRPPPFFAEGRRAPDKGEESAAGGSLAGVD